MSAWRYAAALLGIAIGAPVYFVGWVAGHVFGAARRGFHLGRHFWNWSDPGQGVARG